MAKFLNGKNFDIKNPFRLEKKFGETGADENWKHAEEAGYDDELMDETNDQHKISIKDLCSEDKQRIANLIKELAK